MKVDIVFLYGFGVWWFSGTGMFAFVVDNLNRVSRNIY